MATLTAQLAILLLGPILEMEQTGARQLLGITHSVGPALGRTGARITMGQAVGAQIAVAMLGIAREVFVTSSC